MDNNCYDQLATLLEKRPDVFVFWVTRQDGTDPVKINLFSSSSLFEEFNEVCIGDRFRVWTNHARDQLHMVVGPYPIPAA